MTCRRLDAAITLHQALVLVLIIFLRHAALLGLLDDGGRLLNILGQEGLIKPFSFKCNRLHALSGPIGQTVIEAFVIFEGAT